MSLTGLRWQTLPLPLVQLSLAAVLKCGQSFRWTTHTVTGTEPEVKESNHSGYEYRLCLSDRVVCLRQNATTLSYCSVFPKLESPEKRLLLEAKTLEWLKDYFQLDVDLEILYKDWAGRDEVFASVQNRFAGIRVLRQDPWENLISFICSSNNNIGRITKMVSSLCKEFSPAVLTITNDGEEEFYHPFPPPSALAGPGVAAKLRSLGFGYRAEYIQRTASMLVDTHGSKLKLGETTEPSEVWLQTLRQMSTEQAREELLKFAGVGRKVADCVLLMSLDKREVVPVDTHVYQIAVKHYKFRGTSGKKATMTPKLYEELTSKFVTCWGDHAGWAHTILFTADLKSFATYGETDDVPTPESGQNTPKAETSSVVPGSKRKRKRNSSPPAGRGRASARQTRRRET
ncbi:DNA glycosylase [Pluteus cervinus]|uniref:DNA glycosylase n=1 Tax=Pluteus cervinus TaxID=181527 RepID=A0ACD3BE40_9AGAR|nr:DNA glycosylase [Pluteus cervinus]